MTIFPTFNSLGRNMLEEPVDEPQELTPVIETPVIVEEPEDKVDWEIDFSAKERARTQLIPEVVIQ